jgi:hypothetical protein
MICKAVASRPKFNTAQQGLLATALHIFVLADEYEFVLVCPMLHRDTSHLAVLGTSKHGLSSS